MIKIAEVKIEDIKLNPNNPRIIKDDKFKDLTRSIKEFPKMLQLRPIVVNDDMIVLGGNMRLKACQAAGLTVVPIVKASELTQDEQRRFIIADNLGFGEWDWSMLANEWEQEELKAWGLDTWQTSTDLNIDNFFQDADEEVKQNYKITLEYTEDEFNKVSEAFKKYSGTKEDIVAKLLGV